MVRITEEMIHEITEGMTRSSSMVHDEAPMYGRITSSIQEIESHLAKMDMFKKQFK
jgi:methyl-accepting chemotaxis protein